MMVPLVVAFAFFLEGLDSTIIATAIPAMAEGLGETPLRLNLALTAYLLSAAVFIPVSGWVADRFGMRATFTAAVGIFALGSLASGLAQNFPMLVAARAVGRPVKYHLSTKGCSRANMGARSLSAIAPNTAWVQG